MVRGKFIVLEGMDGAGTTTQMRYLASYLIDKGKEYTPLCTREPTMYTEEGREIRRLLKDPESRNRMGEEAFHHHLANLFVEDRKWHVKYLIEPNRTLGVQVISDRHMISTLAYQGLNLDMDELIRMHEGIPAPDLTLFLDVGADISLKRVLSSTRTGPTELFEESEILRRIEFSYARAIAKVGEAQKVVIIKGNPGLPTPEENIAAVAKAIQAEVDKLYL
jgi:dTMP kinase